MAKGFGRPLADPLYEWLERNFRPFSSFSELCRDHLVEPWPIITVPSSMFSRNPRLTGR